MPRTDDTPPSVSAMVDVTRPTDHGEGVEASTSAVVAGTWASAAASVHTTHATAASVNKKRLLILVSTSTLEGRASWIIGAGQRERTYGTRTPEGVFVYARLGPSGGR